MGRGGVVRLVTDCLQKFDHLGPSPPLTLSSMSCGGIGTRMSTWLIHWIEAMFLTFYSGSGRRTFYVSL